MIVVDPTNENTYPPFDEAVWLLQRCLRDRGRSDKIHWLWREDICIGHVRGQRQMDRRTRVKLAVSPKTSLVERYYNYGIARSLGTALRVFCLTERDTHFDTAEGRYYSSAGEPCCFVYVPENETDAPKSHVTGLNIVTVERPPDLADGILDSQLWNTWVNIVIPPRDGRWTQDVPLRTDADRLTSGAVKRQLSFSL